MRLGLSSNSIKLLACILLVGSCSQAKDQKGPDRTITVGLEGTPKILDSRLAMDAYSSRILPLIYEGLVRVDQNGEPTPRLAEYWENPDPLTYIFHLRRGRRCPDGTEIKAKDVKYTLLSLGDPDLKSPRKYVFNRIASVETDGDCAVKITLKEVYAPILTELNFGIVPEAAAGLESFREKPFGSGPFMVESFEPGEGVILSPNPHYAGEKPTMDRVVFRVLQDPVTRVMALESGEVDLLQNSVPPDDLALLRENPKIEVIVEPGINYNYIGFNLEDPILKKREVRRAIAHAIDRESLAGCLLKGTVDPASGLLAPSNWAYNGAVEVYEYDPELARRILDEAGYEDPDGEGPLPRFELVYKTSTDKTRRWVAEAVAYQLGLVGIEVETRSHEWGTFYEDIKAGRFQMYSLSWVGITEPDIYHFALHSDSVPPSGGNRNRYRNKEMDALLDRGRLVTDAAERRRIYGEVQAIAARDLPYISLWYARNVVAMDGRLSGFKIYPGGDYESLAWMTRR